MVNCFLRFVKSKLLVLFIGLQIIPMLAMSQFNISGKVMDGQTGETLVGAHVQLFNTHIVTSTNSKGEFQISNLKADTYQLKVSFIGYDSYTSELQLINDQVLSIKLQPSMVMQDEVIIKAIRAAEDVPATFTNVGAEQLKRENLGQDLPYMLSRTPSMVVTSDAGAGVGYTGLRIRGTDITRINVTVNGIPLNDPESHGVFWVNMPDFASSVDHVQIQRGVGTSTNGQAAFGGSINIQTTGMRAEPYAELNSAAGSFNTFKNTVSFGTGLLNDKFTIDGRLSKISSDGFIDRATSDLKSFYISAGYYGKSSMLKLNVISGQEKTYQAWNGVPKVKLLNDTIGMLDLAADNWWDEETTQHLLNSDARTYNSYTYENETDNYQQDHYQLIYSNQITKGLLFNAAAHYTYGRGYYEQYKKGRKYEDYQLENPVFGNDTITRTDLIQQKWLDNHFYGATYSLNYKENNFDAIIGGSWNKYEGGHYGEVIWMQNAGSAPKNYEWYNNMGTKTDLNVYAKATYMLADMINLYGDIQYRAIDYSIAGIHDDLRDLTQEHTYNFINPKLGAYYKIGEHQNAYVSFAVANREPSRSVFRDAGAGELPVPERMLDYEIGHEFQTTNFSIATNLFYMDYKDQLVLTGEINDVGAAIMTNAPESYRAGIEVSTGFKVTDFMDWATNVSYSQNKIKNFTTYVDNWDTWGQEVEELGTVDIAFSPDWIVDNILTFHPAKDFNVALMTKFVSDQYIDNTSSEERKLDAYLVNDIKMDYTLRNFWFKEINFSLALNNILNEEYETNAWVYRYYLGNTHKVMDGYYPQAGMNFMAGIRIGL